MGGAEANGTSLDAIAEGDLIGALAGADLEDRLAEMRAGEQNVNMHKNDGVDPPNIGPNDFPGGEIRDQLGPRP